MIGDGQSRVRPLRPEYRCGLVFEWASQSACKTSACSAAPATDEAGAARGNAVTGGMPLPATQATPAVGKTWVTHPLVGGGHRMSSTVFQADGE